MSKRGLDRLRPIVAVASIVYVALPTGTWMVGWLAPIFALFGVTALCTGVVSLINRLGDSATREDRDVSRLEIAMVVLVVGVLFGLSGAGGFGIQTDDWLKHNAVLGDLIDRRWPVVYRTSADPIALVYYVGYYLPAALVGKVWGWAAANVALYLWTVLGGALVALWLVVGSRAPVWLGLLGFSLFGGLDVVGALSRAYGPASYTPWYDNFALEWWEGNWVFPGQVSLMAYVPQQALGGWLLTAVALDRLRARSADFPYVLIVALLLMWSPYAAIGLLLLIAGARLGQPLRPQLSIANFAGVVVGGLCSIYFLGRASAVELPEAYTSTPAVLQRQAFAIGLSNMPPATFAKHYVASVALEFLLLACLLLAAYRHRPVERRILLAGTLILLVLPFVRHGHYNDLVMRVAIPPLFMLLTLTLAALPALRPGIVRWGLIVVLAGGAIYPANMLRLNIVKIAERGSLFHLPPVVSLFEQQREVRHYWAFLYQYVCPLDSFFFRHLSSLDAAEVARRADSVVDSVSRAGVCRPSFRATTGDCRRGVEIARNE